jgi:hypothetical protein
MAVAREQLKDMDFRDVATDAAFWTNPQAQHDLETTYRDLHNPRQR